MKPYIIRSYITDKWCKGRGKGKVKGQGQGQGQSQGQCQDKRKGQDRDKDKDKGKGIGKGRGIGNLLDQIIFVRVGVCHHDTLQRDSKCRTESDGRDCDRLNFPSLKIKRRESWVNTTQTMTVKTTLPGASSHWNLRSPIDRPWTLGFKKI